MCANNGSFPYLPHLHFTSLWNKQRMLEAQDPWRLKPMGGSCSNWHTGITPERREAAPMVAHNFLARCGASKKEEDYTRIKSSSGCLVSHRPSWATDLDSRSKEKKKKTEEKRKHPRGNKLQQNWNRSLIEGTFTVRCILLSLLFCFKWQNSTSKHLDTDRKTLLLEVESK